jgi:4-aminobutyrate aminotransferase / (S)-3-amino-2-methylpropionate transaminase / 5-aminovalerate transaminase
MEAVHVGGIGGTFGGNPIACAAALAVLRIVEEEGLLARAERIGAVMTSRLVDMAQRSPLIGEVRGRGAMVAMEMVEDRETKAPAKDATSRLIEECYRQGVVILKAGTYDNVIRLLPPLTIDEDLLSEGLDVLEKALATVEETSG